MPRQTRYPEVRKFNRCPPCLRETSRGRHHPGPNLLDDLDGRPIETISWSDFAIFDWLIRFIIITIVRMVSVSVERGSFALS